MSDYKNEPAFAQQERYPSIATQAGITRLEWFAGAALQGLLADTAASHRGLDEQIGEFTAKQCFMYAEALCAEAEKRRNQ